MRIEHAVSEEASLNEQPLYVDFNFLGEFNEY